MDDLWARIGLIWAVLAIAVSVALMQRRRALDPVRRVDAPGFDPGAYFFSSATCATCDEAREKLTTALGHDGYTEIRWEDEPTPFESIGVGAVPAVMIVDERGRARLYAGQPDHALGELDP